MTHEDIFKAAMTFAATHNRPYTHIQLALLLTEFADGLINTDTAAKEEQKNAFNTARGGMKS